jgi:hypothetical protein
MQQDERRPVSPHMPNHVAISTTGLDPLRFGLYSFHDGHGLFANQVRHLPLVIAEEVEHDKENADRFVDKG